jgi:brefeldin A-inhibited guanine nucleotide-exchange protein
MVTTFLTWRGRLGLGVLQDYNKLRGDTQAKNIAAWTPVVAEIVHGLCRFDEKAVSLWITCNHGHANPFFQFSRYLPAIYPLVVELLARDVSPEVRQAIRQFFTRVGVSQGVIEA